MHLKPIAVTAWAETRIQRDLRLQSSFRARGAVSLAARRPGPVTPWICSSYARIKMKYLAEWCPGVSVIVATSVYRLGLGTSSQLATGRYSRAGAAWDRLV